MTTGKKVLISVLTLALVAGCSTTSSKKYGQLDDQKQDSQVATSGYGERSGFSGSDQMNWQERALMSKRTFYFGFDKFDINEDDQKALDVHAKYLNSHPDSILRIEGHTDERGSREYNVGLGERRASVITKYLLSRGVDESQLSEVSYGKEKPADPRNNQEAHQRNRRAYLVYERS
ncbi:MAG: peptidoglycan-associated lipoprotein [Legionellales bacterium]|nr:peptidoglycan-associated lipoprotein [Legionellales bacterium]|tara:strand:+ start:574 stop:1101 length:528 start_codon:yes stop_codon:yes gene_type:complete